MKTAADVQINYMYVRVLPFKIHNCAGSTAAEFLHQKNTGIFTAGYVRIHRQSFQQRFYEALHFVASIGGATVFLCDL